MKYFTLAVTLLFVAGYRTVLTAGSAPHPCERECGEGAKPMVCTYNFRIEWYYSMSKACYDCPLNKTDCYRPLCVTTDGRERAIMVANRQLPGPAIIVCEKDEVVVNIDNKMSLETTTIHWHGIHQREGTAYMDGVPMVTQCPIPPHSKFQYKFIASTPGTHFWHSHSGTQRMDGLQGVFVVRQTASRDPHHDLYDFDLAEHAIIVQDWMQEVGISKFMKYYYDGGDRYADSILINGKGTFEGFPDKNTNKLVYTPYEEFKVKQGYRYRFRVIDGGTMDCPVLVSVDGHNLTVIASDGVPMEPFEVESFSMLGGERYDFILTANNTVGNYWIRMQGLTRCERRKAKQAAILRYEGSAEVDPPGGTTYEDMARNGTSLNQPYISASEENANVVEMNSTFPDDPAISKPEADVRFILDFEQRRINDYPFSDPPKYPVKDLPEVRLFPVNNVSMVMPSAPPLYQYTNTPEAQYCDVNRLTGCVDGNCWCSNTLRVKLNQVVEIILIDDVKKYDSPHPIHMHGYNFRVVAVQKVGPQLNAAWINEMDMAGKIKRKLSRAIIKDTIILPHEGYTIIRFHANNPGMWLFHCHVDFHQDMGMMVMIQVGEPHQFPKVPRSFPRCGNYPPPVEPTTPTPKKRNPCTSGAPGHVLNSTLLALLASIVLIMIR